MPREILFGGPDSSSLGGGSDLLVFSGGSPDTLARLPPGPPQRWEQGQNGGKGRRRLEKNVGYLEKNGKFAVSLE